MGKKRKGKAVRKNRERGGADEDAEIVHAPHSFVIHRGATGKYVQVSLCTSFLLLITILYCILSLLYKPNNCV